MKHLIHILSIIIEKLHRFLYDKVFVHNHKTSFKEFCINKIYSILFKILPNWRDVLHEYIKNLNVNRYSKKDNEL